MANGKDTKKDVALSTKKIHRKHNMTLTLVGIVDD